MPKEVPIFQCHGEMDSTITFEIGKMTHEALKTLKISNCEFHAYSDMDHCSCLQVRNEFKLYIFIF